MRSGVSSLTTSGGSALAATGGGPLRLWILRLGGRHGRGAPLHRARLDGRRRRLLHGGLRGRLAPGERLLVVTEAAGVDLDLAALQQDHARRHALEEAPIVRD